MGLKVIATLVLACLLLSWSSQAVLFQQKTRLLADLDDGTEQDANSHDYDENVVEETSSGLGSTNEEDSWDDEAQLEGADAVVDGADSSEGSEAEVSVVSGSQETIKVGASPIASPCPRGYLPVANNQPVVTNGCGSGFWSQLVTGFFKFNSIFQTCCHAHDRCYSKCASTLFGLHFSACNIGFWNCMNRQCNSHTTDINSLLKCRQTSNIFFDAVQKWGGSAFNNAQKRHCNCLKYP